MVALSFSSTLSPSVPAAEKQPHSMRLLPAHFTFRMVLCRVMSRAGFLQTWCLELKFIRPENIVSQSLKVLIGAFLKIPSVFSCVFTRAGPEYSNIRLVWLAFDFQFEILIFFFFFFSFFLNTWHPPRNYSHSRLNMNRPWVNIMNVMIQFIWKRRQDCRRPQLWWAVTATLNCHLQPNTSLAFRPLQLRQSAFSQKLATS